MKDVAVEIWRRPSLPLEVKTIELTKMERETIINFNEAEKCANVYTHNTVLKRALELYAAEYPDVCQLVKASHDGEAADYTIPKSWVKIRPPRVQTPAQREASLRALAKRRDLTADTPQRGER